MTDRDFDRRLQLIEEQNKKLKEDIHDLQAGAVSLARDISILNKTMKELRNEVIVSNKVIEQIQLDITQIVALCENAWGVTGKPGSRIIIPG